MNLTKTDLQYYIREDAKVLGYDTLPFFKRFLRVYFDKHIRFHIELRKFEYYSNRLEKLKWGQIGSFSYVLLSLFYLQEIILYFRFYN